MVALLPRLTSLVVYDNSAEGDPEAGATPEPRRMLRTAAGRIVAVAPAAQRPEWVRPIVAAAILSDERAAGRAG